MKNSASPGSFHDELGVWISVNAASVPATARPALFLDRDGVIVEEPGYLHRAEDVVMIPGAAEVIASANRLGVPVVVITNQAGIGRGYYGWSDFCAVESTIAENLRREGAILDGVFACPYHRNGVEPWKHPDHPARKPRPGMLLAAARLLNIELSRSWIVGDKMVDIEAGFAAGLRGGMQVLTGEGPEHRAAALNWTRPNFELQIGASIRDAAPLVPVLAINRT